MGDLAVGATFGEYLIRGVAGRGGMGIVYRAMHVPLKREVALKVIAPELSADSEFRARFRREIESAAAIEHDNVITVYHAGEEDGLLFVTMPLVEGMDLGRVLALEGRLEPVRAARVVAQVADALDAAHALGLVHRDVKPSNVLLEGSGRALLTDFGLTKRIDSRSSLTQAGTLMGTIDYTPPEQLQGAPVDTRADVYALGCLLFEALTRRVPFPHETPAAKLFAHLTETPPAVSPLVPGVPGAMDDVVMRALAKEPADRYMSAGELGRAALAAVGASAGPVEQKPRRPARPGLMPPALLNEVAAGSFVGRSEAVEEFLGRYARAVAGERQFVLVAGEAGIGKTRFVAEVAQRVLTAGAQVLYGRSDLESLVPYQPFITAIQHYIAHRDTLAFPVELEPELRELARFVPAVRSRLPTSVEELAADPETRRYRLFEAVTRVLAFVAHDAPTVVVLDDLQWADSSTALLLAHVWRDVEPIPLLVLATFREPGESSCAELTPFLQQLGRGAGFTRLALRGL